MSSRLGRFAAAMVLGLSFAIPTQAATEWPARFAQIRGLLDTGKLEEAVGEGQALTTATPEDAAAWYWLGRAYGRQAMEASMFSMAGLAKKSKAAYEKSVALDPKLMEAHYDLMQYLIRAPGFVGGDEDLARVEAKTVATLDPVYGHLSAALIAEAVDEDEAAAEREYRAAAESNELVGKLQLANFLMQRKRWADTRKFWQTQRDATPDDPLAGYFLGRLSIEDGIDNEAGLTGIDKFIAANNFPREIPAAVAHWRRALLLEKMGRLDEAKPAIAKARELLPGNERIDKDYARIAE